MNLIFFSDIHIIRRLKSNILLISLASLSLCIIGGCLHLHASMYVKGLDKISMYGIDSIGYNYDYDYVYDMSSFSYNWSVVQAKNLLMKQDIHRKPVSTSVGVSLDSYEVSAHCKHVDSCPSTAHTTVIFVNDGASREAIAESRKFLYYHPEVAATASIPLSNGNRGGQVLGTLSTFIALLMRVKSKYVLLMEGGAAPHVGSGKTRRMKDVDLATLVGALEDGNFGILGGLVGYSEDNWVRLRNPCLHMNPLLAGGNIGIEVKPLVQSYSSGSRDVRGNAWVCDLASASFIARTDTLKSMITDLNSVISRSTMSPGSVWETISLAIYRVAKAKRSINSNGGHFDVGVVPTEIFLTPTYAFAEVRREVRNTIPQPIPQYCCRSFKWNNIETILGMFLSVLAEYQGIRKTRVDWMVNESTLHGIFKSGYILPWDTTADILIYINHGSVEWKEFKKLWLKRGFRLTSTNDKSPLEHYEMWLSGFQDPIYSTQLSVIFLDSVQRNEKYSNFRVPPEDLRLMPFKNLWVSVPGNPARYIRTNNEGHHLTPSCKRNERSPCELRRLYIATSHFVLFFIIAIIVILLIWRYSNPKFKIDSGNASGKGDKKRRIRHWKN